MIISWTRNCQDSVASDIWRTRLVQVEGAKVMLDSERFIDVDEIDSKF